MNLLVGILEVKYIWQDIMLILQRGEMSHKALLKG